MLRMSKLTDYATVVLAQMVQRPDEVHSAADLAAASTIAQPTVSKLLKSLARAGLVTSSRGSTGGYTLARPPESITAADIIDALEGPVALTVCSTSEQQCEFESRCRVGSAWQRINQAIRASLSDISLLDLQTADFHFPPPQLVRERPILRRDKLRPRRADTV